MVSSTAFLLGALSLVAGAAAQSTAPQYGQVGLDSRRLRYHCIDSFAVRRYRLDWGDDVPGRMVMHFL